MTSVLSKQYINLKNYRSALRKKYSPSQNMMAGARSIYLYQSSSWQECIALASSQQYQWQYPGQSYPQISGPQIFIIYEESTKIRIPISYFVLCISLVVYYYHRSKTLPRRLKKEICCIICLTPESPDFSPNKYLKKKHHWINNQYQ